MTIPAIITTCDARPQYLDQTRIQVQEAGFKKQVWCDGDSDLFLNTAARVGIVPAYRLAMTYFLKGFGRFVIFQDDILIAKGLHDWILDNAPTEGVVSLYTASPHDGKDGWRRLDLEPTKDNPYPWHHCLGGCAILWNKDAAEKILAEPPPIRTDRLGGWIGDFCYHNNIPFWVHSPSLVQHIGEESVRVGAPLSSDRQAKRFCKDVKELE